MSSNVTDGRLEEILLEPESFRRVQHHHDRAVVVILACILFGYLCYHRNYQWFFATIICKRTRTLFAIYFITLLNANLLNTFIDNPLDICGSLNEDWPL